MPTICKMRKVEADELQYQDTRPDPFPMPTICKMRKVEADELQYQDTRPDPFLGEKMRQIAQQRQVLCITHLPQVAAHASAHFLVTKHTRSGRTLSEITLLEPKDRVTEVARMLGGQSDAARKHAAVLLETGKG